ncbi:MAG TPA: NAD(P)-binding protein [Gemmatimonadales bacterium]|nr:NAD(P)-binding protein [Gemmatimonadales bacterium]
MTDASDRRLGMDRNISRRDFLDGLAIATGMALLPFGCARGGEDTYAPEQAPDYYPPALTGLRGSHPGSYEVAHQLRDGTLEPTIGRTRDTGERYDLVVVGAGISGLAAAYFYRKARPDARILLLDNHDDLGGHAKRNEFTVGDSLLISYGGTESIESPAQYSTVARGLLSDLGIDLQRFYTAFDRGRYQKLGMTRGIFFDRETFGVDRMVQGSVSDISRKTLDRAPLTEAIKRDILRVNGNRTNHFPGLTSSEKKARLARMSYRDFLLNVVKVVPGVIPLFQAMTHDLYGVGIDAIPALDCWGLEMPGFEGLKLGSDEPRPGIGRTPLLEMNEEEPYIFHFPDGNASVARLLARRLIPQALPGDSMDDVVTARLAYGKLDQPSNPTRIRLNSTVIRVRHLGDPASAREVDVSYVRGGKARSVRAGACVLACWNMVIPYLCPELSDSQKQALAYGAKVPLVYTNVALNNWRALQKAGVSHVYAPGSYWVNTFLDFPVDLGAYQAPRTPDDPAVVKMVRTPCKPGSPSRVQHRAGHQELLQTPFETFERAVRDQLGRMFGPTGFDPARDITAITVNRWPHGYTYEYNSLWDGPWTEGEEPCVVGRRQFGRITIANADAGAFAYTNSAIDQAWRAVEGLLGGAV